MTRKVMTAGDLLAWAYEEKQLAESLELMKSSLPEDVVPLVDKQIQIRRERSAWLDEQADEAIGVAEFHAEGG